MGKQWIYNNHNNANNSAHNVNMKIVIMTSEYNLPANIALHSFLKNPLLKKHKIEVVGIIASVPYSYNSAKRFFKKSGWYFPFKEIFVNTWKFIGIKFAKWFIPNRLRNYFDISEIAQKYKIPYKEVKSINSDEAKNFMKKFKTDYLVSCFLLQIVDSEILKIPKKGAINAHPSLIQNHRGRLVY